MSHDPKPLDRLVAIGYGFLDNHVNDVIDSALARPYFRLLILTKALGDEAWARWSAKANVIVATEARSSLEGAAGPGHPNLWSFERLAKEV